MTEAAKQAPPVTGWVVTVDGRDEPGIATEDQARRGAAYAARIIGVTRGPTSPWTSGRSR